MNINIALKAFVLAHPHTDCFAHDIHITELSGKSDTVIICCHGYGADYHIAHAVQAQSGTSATFVGFNFPDYAIGRIPYDFRTLTFGSMRELLPLIYVLKKYIIDRHTRTIDLYGFSAGGAAVINALGVLNSTAYDTELMLIGVYPSDKQTLLHTIQKGIIILDAPLKSIEEIIEARGTSPEFEFLAKQYTRNAMRPLDSVKKLTGLSLNILLYLEQPDEILSNSYDTAFTELLTKANNLGTTTVITGRSGGHNGTHQKLWRAYREHKKVIARPISKRNT